MAGTEITPIVEYCDHPDDPNYVVVKAEIPDLLRARCCGKYLNASIDFQKTNSSFFLLVKMNDDSKVYKLDIKKLPRKIIEDDNKTFYKVFDINKDEIEIHLHKEVPEPWSQFLSTVGLDHCSEVV